MSAQYHLTHIDIPSNGLVPQEYNNPRSHRCDEVWLFGIAILLYSDKGVPVLSAGFQ